MIRYVLLFLISGILFSCSSVKKTVVHKETSNITEGKLFKNIASSELDYSTLYSKKVELSVNINGKGNTLKGMLKIKRDSFIWMSVTAPLGIEVARIYLTPDSVKFLDSYNKKYLLTDYNFFFDRFGIDIQFDCIQKILTNVYFNLENCGQNEYRNDKFKFEKSDNDYVLSNLQKRAINRKIKKFFKKKRKNKDFALVLQKIHIDPEFFRPYKLSLEDLEEDMGVNAVYADFQNYNGKIFPAKIVFSSSFDNNTIKVELKFSRLEFDVNVVPSFRVPGKYKNLNVERSQVE